MYMAISQDGFIAGPNDETPWSDDEFDAFETFVQSCDVVVMGRRTFEIMMEDDELIEGPEYIVATHDELLVDGIGQVVITSAEDMPEGEHVGVIGGGDLNGQLMKLGVIDELILDIEPVMLGQGIRLFGDHDVALRMELIDSRPIGEGGTIQRHYRIVPESSYIDADS